MTDNEKQLIVQIDILKNLKKSNDELNEVRQKRIIVLETEKEKMKEQIITFKEIINKIIEKI